MVSITASRTPAAIAGRAGGDDVLPDRLAPAATGDHVVDRQPGPLAAAVLAGPVIPPEYIFSRWLEFFVPRYSDVLNKDYRSG